MKRVATELGTQVLRQRVYREYGKYSVRTAINRFGAWSKAINQAGLENSVDRNITDIQLLENLLLIWTRIGRQPRYSEIRKPDSIYNISTYERRFGSWRAALEVFVGWANSEELEAPDIESVSSSSTPRQKTPRQPNLRLYFRVLRRDRFTCCACGASPATDPGTRLQVDHVIPWSNGGATTEENLQTLCEKCNQGKSNSTD